MTTLWAVKLKTDETIQLFIKHAVKKIYILFEFYSKFGILITGVFWDIWYFRERSLIL